MTTPLPEVDLFSLHLKDVVVVYVFGVGMEGEGVGNEPGNEVGTVPYHFVLICHDIYHIKSCPVVYFTRTKTNSKLLVLCTLTAKEKSVYKDQTRYLVHFIRIIPGIYLQILLTPSFCSEIQKYKPSPSLLGICMHGRLTCL